MTCNYIAGLNEELVQLLLMRDELHMEQDAMLVDVEDLTRLGRDPFKTHLKLEYECTYKSNLFFSCLNRHAHSQQRHMMEKSVTKGKAACHGRCDSPF